MNQMLRGGLIELLDSRPERSLCGVAISPGSRQAAFLKHGSQLGSIATITNAATQIFPQGFFCAVCVWHLVRNW